MSRQPPNSSNDGWLWATEIVLKNEEDFVCGPAKSEPVEPALRESRSREAGEAGRIATNQSMPAPGSSSATSIGNRRPSLERSPETPPRNRTVDPQPHSQTFETGNIQLRMDSSEGNYILASNSRRAVFPGPPIPRSEIPRTVGLDRSAVLSLLQDAPEGFLNSKMPRMTSESERYQNMVYAPKNRRVESAAAQTEYLQPSQSSTSNNTQNARAAENRQDQPRVKTPDQNDKDEEDDQEPSSSEDENRRGCRQH